MHIYTFRASTLKFFAVVALAVAALVSLAVVIPRYMEPESVLAAANYKNIETNEERREFLASFGYEVTAETTEVAEIVVPESFDSVYEVYNGIQRRQGLDLADYKGKKATRYTYTVTNYGQEQVIANLIIYKGRIIAGDICCPGENGFIHGFEKPHADSAT